MTSFSLQQSCPCGSGQNYEHCCYPIHQNAALAQKPVQLMRARYCAFVLKKGDFLLATHWPATRGELTAASYVAGAQQWQGLTIESSSAVAEQQGWVTFAARFRAQGQDHVHWERSLFQYDEGRWFYVSGEFDPPLVTVGRNSPCPCGSGKKFKRCCGQ